MEMQWDSKFNINRLQESLQALYNILIEFCIPVELTRLIKKFLNKTCSKIYVDKHVSCISIQN